MREDSRDRSFIAGRGEYDVEALVREALRARTHAYAPYSHFLVGAAILGETGEVYGGCNVENASFGVTICAEQSAVAHAVVSGEKSFVAIAVVADSPDACTPCGKCRQALVEFGSDLVVIGANTSGAREVTRLSMLLPGAFERGQLPTLKTEGPRPGPFTEGREG